MDFKGAAKPLSANDVSTIAGYLGCEVAAVRAVIAVESAGDGFKEGRPLILNEPHVFYRELDGAERDEAVSQGLAYKAWRTKPYPKTQDARYAWLDAAMKVNETAALRSCSWGLGQMMGFNHKACGFETVRDFVKAMCESEGAHLYAMARFIVSKGLHRHLRVRDWAKFAHGYNGSGYAANKYDTKLESAYASRSGGEKHIPPPATADELSALVGRPAPTPPPKPDTVEHADKAPASTQWSLAGWLSSMFSKEDSA